MIFTVNYLIFVIQSNTVTVDEKLMDRGGVHVSNQQLARNEINMRDQLQAMKSGNGAPSREQLLVQITASVSAASSRVRTPGVDE